MYQVYNFESIPSTLEQADTIETGVGFKVRVALFIGSLVISHGITLSTIIMASIGSPSNHDVAVLLVVAFTVPITTGQGAAFSARVLRISLVHSPDQLLVSCTKQSGDFLLEDFGPYKLLMQRAGVTVLFALFPMTVVRNIDVAQAYVSAADTLASVISIAVSLWFCFSLWNRKLREPALSDAVVFATVVVLPGMTLGVLGAFLSGDIVSSGAAVAMIVIGFTPCSIFGLVVLWTTYNTAYGYLSLLMQVVMGEHTALLNFKNLRYISNYEHIASMLTYFCQDRDRSQATDYSVFLLCCGFCCHC